jgi:hypothetical protein
LDLLFFEKSFKDVIVGLGGLGGFVFGLGIDLLFFKGFFQMF